MIISHKIRLDPNNKQATYFAKAAGTARFAKKGESRDSFTLTNDQFGIDTYRIRIPHLGSVRMRAKDGIRLTGI